MGKSIQEFQKPKIGMNQNPFKIHSQKPEIGMNQNPFKNGQIENPFKKSCKSIQLNGFFGPFRFEQHQGI